LVKKENFIKKIEIMPKGLEIGVHDVNKRNGFCHLKK
jgi:hypothetical protein